MHAWFGWPVSENKKLASANWKLNTQLLKASPVSSTMFPASNKVYSKTHTQRFRFCELRSSRQVQQLKSLSFNAELNDLASCCSKMGRMFTVQAAINAFQLTYYIDSCISTTRVLYSAKLKVINTHNSITIPSASYQKRWKSVKSTERLVGYLSR